MNAMKTKKKERKRKKKKKKKYIQMRDTKEKDRRPRNVSRSH